MSSTERVKNLEQYDLSIGGHALTISSDQNPEQVDSIVHLVNEKIEVLLKRNYSFQQSLMVALLQVSEELVNLKSGLKNQVEDIEKQATQILAEFKNMKS